MSRLRPAPAVPQMDMDLHLARVQQRWRFADDELAPGETLNVEALAYDMKALPDRFEGTPVEITDVLFGFFDSIGPAASGASDPGGSIEPASDDDGVLMSDGAMPEPAALA